MSDKAILKIVNVSKSFNSNVALSGINLSIRAGEVHALMGENGAGKSTLMKIINGIYEADQGEMFFYDRPYKVKNPHEAMAQGIAMIHQELNPVLDMRVFENIFLGREYRKNFLVDEARMIEETRAMLESMDVAVDPTAYMRSLSVAQIQLVEIVKAISFAAKVIIMDEPTSAITEAETEVFFRQIKKLKEAGVAIIYISHKMEEIFRIVDRVSVLRDGHYIGTYPISEINYEDLIYLMVNRKLNDIFPLRTGKIAEPKLKVENLSALDKLVDISFQVRAGEILGVAGLVGSGRSELVETIFGLHKMQGGKLNINGKEENISSPEQAIKAGIALITEDRKQTGLNLIGTVAENITIVSLKSFRHLGVLNSKLELEKASEFVKLLKIKAHSIKNKVISLSGGNQQKIVIAKWLLNNPEIIIFDEPTRGIDIGAKREIYNIINDLADAGKAVIIISSEMSELIGMSDRIIVMSEGKLTGEVEKEQFSQELIMKYASNLRS